MGIYFPQRYLVFLKIDLYESLKRKCQVLRARSLYVIFVSNFIRYEVKNNIDSSI